MRSVVGDAELRVMGDRRRRSRSTHRTAPHSAPPGSTGTPLTLYTFIQQQQLHSAHRGMVSQRIFLPEMGLMVQEASFRLGQEPKQGRTFFKNLSIVSSSRAIIK